MTSLNTSPAHTTSSTMSADDDTFDIDIYGEEELEEPQAQSATNGGQQEHEEPEPQYTGEDDLYGDDKDATTGAQPTLSSAAAPAATEHVKPSDPVTQPAAQPTTTTTPATQPPPPNNLKRKAPSPSPSPSLDPSAQPALKLAELPWHTTEETLRHLCALSNAESALTDLTFGEHKINGKSKGEVYLEFSSREACSRVKRAVEEANANGSGGVARGKWTVYYVPAGTNPFKNASASGGGKDGGRAGAYQSSGAGRGGGGGAYNQRGGGNFSGRGGFRGGAGGGFQQNRGTPPFAQQQQQQQQQVGWGMNGMNGAGGFGNNNMNPMAMMGAGGFNNMASGNGMMGMMGRGGAGFGMGNMMGMGMGNMMGGMRGGMMGRGNWGGGFQQGQGYGGAGGNGYGGAGDGGGGQGAGKRARME